MSDEQSRGPAKPGSAKPGSAEPELTGPELARAALEAAQARRQAARPRRRASGSGTGLGDGRRRGYTGPGPDPRDPQLFGSVLERLVKARGWQKPTAEATVFGAWERVVGADIAAHCKPTKLEDGELTIEAESTAWATQLRTLSRQLLHRIAVGVGRDVVRRIRVVGPSGPSWRHGPRHVRGRGPRDTYG